MDLNNRYDSLFKFYLEKYLKNTSIDFNTLKSQAIVESNLNPNAISKVGAKGLMQFLPDTFKEWSNGDIFNPELSIKAACKYLNYLYSCFSEIPSPYQRRLFTLASYNSGRGNINKTLELSRKSCGLPSSYREWKKQNSLNGKWQYWNYTSRFLKDITGKNNSDETIYYVVKIDNEYGVNI